MRLIRNHYARGWLAALLVLAMSPLRAQDTAALPTTAQSQIDAIARQALKDSGAPSISLAIVKDGRVVYRHAYGQAQLEPRRAAASDMRYGIGSNSKEFLAAAILMLESEGRLSLDDRIDKYVANLGPAGAVTLRQLLSHTAGIRDYWPQDYVPAEMLTPISHEALLDRWARQPLDFPPGERWRYSNTGYVLAGMALEKVAGQPLFAFLQQRIFTPLHMESVVDIDAGRLSAQDATGYTSYGLGPLVPAPKEAPGWLFAAGELAMTAEDLALWDISVMNRSLMSAAAYQSLETETLLNNGAGSRYALGYEVYVASERRVLAHGGEVSGFISSNTLYPDAHAAIVALTNCDTSIAANDIVHKLADVLFAPTGAAELASQALARRILDDLSRGLIARELFSANANDYFSAAAVKSTARSLSRLGPVKSFDLKSTGMRGGMTERDYKVEYAKKRFDLVVYILPDGKIEQFKLFPG